MPALPSEFRGARAEVAPDTSTGDFSRYQGIQCSQINLHHCVAAVHSLNDWFDATVLNTPPAPQGERGGSKVEKEFAKVALIQEPYLLRNKVHGFNLKALNLFVGNGKGKIRSAIITSKSLEAWLLTQYSDEDQVAIGINCGGNVLVMASTYMPYDSADPPPSKMFKDLTDFCFQKNYQLIVGADANSHNAAWGSTDTNDRGDKLLDYILTTQLQICNQGEKPTFANSVREEVIDITLASTGIERKIINWNVSEKENFSDHNTINFSIMTDCRGQTDTYRNVRKTDWNLYRSLLEDRIDIPNENDSLDVHTEKLTNVITSSYFDSCRLTRTKKKTKPPWWSGELTNLKREAARQRRRYRRNPTVENELEKKNALRKYTLELQSAKRKGWQAFCKEMNELDSNAKISKILKVGERKGIGTIKDNITGELSSTPEEALQFLLKAHFPDQAAGQEEPVAGPGEDDTAQQRQVSPENEIFLESICERMITKDALKAAFDSFKPFKAPGIDGIFPVLIKKGLDILEDQILSLYKKSIKGGRVPIQWTKSRVAFIPKPGKADYTDPKSYRPISLSSFLLKGLERLVLWDLQVTVERLKPMKPNIFSYREGKSTEDALHLLVHNVEKALNTQRVAVAMFLDIEAAFNNATFGSMKEVLVEKGVVMPLTEWIYNSLKARVATAQQGSFRAEKTITKGCPQGGILSPYIWNLIMDDLLKMFPNLHSTFVIVYADDVMLLGIGIDEKIVVENLKKDVTILQRWAEKHKLSFSPSKTKLMLFSRRRHQVKPNLKIGGVDVDWVDVHKYLGMHLDSKLNWNKHILETLKRATYTLARCRMLIGRYWGLNPRAMSWLYTAVVRPILTYGAIFWAKKLEEAKVVKDLGKFQRKACLMITNASSSTPTAGMEAVLSMRPLHIHLKELALSCFHRMSRQNTWLTQAGDASAGHGKTVMSWAREIPDLKMPTDKLKEKYSSGKLFKTLILEREDFPTERGKPMPNAEDTIHVFTDGSKIEDKSGAAYLIRSRYLRKHNYFPLGPLSTVFQAETVAVSEAAKELLELEVKNKKILFLVDSQSAILALGKFTTQGSLVKQAKENLNRLGLSNEVIIQWIPGHEGYMGNEVADRLAKRGATEPFWGPEPGLPLTNTFFKNLIREWGRDLHNREWRARKDCRQTKMFVKDIGQKPKAGFMSLNRRAARTAIQLMSGHNNLQRHRFLMKMEESPTCEKCGLEEETAEHFLIMCPAYWEERLKIWGSRMLDQGDLVHLRVQDLQKFANVTERFVSSP